MNVGWGEWVGDGIKIMMVVESTLTLVKVVLINITAVLSSTRNFQEPTINELL